MTANKESTKSKACQIMGYHRDTFYEVRRAFQVGGVAALVEQKRGLRGPHPNRVAPEIEERILALCLEHPTYGAQRIANELRLQGVDVSPSGVRGIWMRHVEANAPGELLNQDTFYWRTLKECRQDLRPGRRRCLLLTGLRQGLHLEDADHGRRSALRPRPLTAWSFSGVSR